MIIEGNPAGNVGWWSKHLMRVDTNERVEVKEIRGLVADTLPDALREMQAVASGSRSHGNFMYQANINPLAHEQLNPDQWQAAVDLLEKNLGLEGHQRVVVEHVKEGRQHVHVVWNRVDQEDLRVADMGGNYYSHERTARELEQRFDLEPTPRAHGNRDGPRETEHKPEMWEIERAQQSGIDPKAMKAELTELWRSTESGKEFAAALEARGYLLAKGDRRDFCVVDPAGHEHSLARRLDGVKAKDVRERMADVDGDALPSVAEGREQQKGRVGEQRSAERVAAPAPQPKESATEKMQIVEVADPRPTDALPRKPEKDDFSKEYQKKQDKATERQIERMERKADADLGKSAPLPAKAGLKVADGITGVVAKLADFLSDLLTGSSAPPPRQNLDQVERIIAQRRATAALEKIRDQLARGQAIGASEVRNMTRDQIANILENGDDALRRMIEQIERERQQQRDSGRTRER